MMSISKKKNLIEYNLCQLLYYGSYQTKHLFPSLIIKIDQFFLNGGNSPRLFLSSMVFMLPLSLYLSFSISIYRTLSIVFADFTISFSNLFSCSHYLHLPHPSSFMVFLLSVFSGFLLDYNCIWRTSSS